MRTERDGERNACGHWLADRRLTQERRVRFYVGWVRRFLRRRAARPRGAWKDSLRVFLDDRAESGTRDGQLRQAAEAVTGYCGPFRVPQNTPVCGPGDAGTGVVEPAEALAHMQRLVQLRHYLPRTERSYLGWARLTGVSPQLRTKDIDFDRGTVSVRSGKGDTDRVTFLPRRSMDDLRAHLGEVRMQHDHDLHPRAPPRSPLDRQPAPTGSTSSSRRGYIGATRNTLEAWGEASCWPPTSWQEELGMSTSLLLEPYAALHQEILQVLLAGKARARQAVEQEKVRTYWKIGQRLHTHLVQHGERAGYGEQLMAQLAADLELSERLLYEGVALYRAFPILNTYSKLSWSHYRELLRVPAHKERKFYAQQVDRAGWSVRELRTQIKGNTFALPSSQADEVQVVQVQPGPPLVPRKGRLYAYRLVAAPRSRELRLDLGFRVRRALELENLEGAGPGAVVAAVREPGNAQGGPAYRLAAGSSKPSWLYTFRAEVGEVVDGDALWVVIDCGFDTWVEQKLRLRGLDAPELDTAAGRQARGFVEEVLGRVAFVVLSTHRTDKYDRYLADVFYQPGEPDPQRVLQDGVYLNQQLLEEGLAIRWTE